MGIIKDFEKRIKEIDNKCIFTGVIYCYTNLINGKKYIGQTFRETERKQEHKQEINHNTNNYFHLAIKKYGWDNFKYEVLYKRNYLDSESLHNSLNILEVYYINKYNTFNHDVGYNKTTGGAIVITDDLRIKISNGLKGELNPFFGKHHTEEQKEKWRKERKGKHNYFVHPLKGKHLSEEHKQRLSESEKGRIITEETKQKIRDYWSSEKRIEQSERKKGENNYMFGKHLTEETKHKLSEKAKERFSNEEERNKAKEMKRDKMKPIIQYLLNGEICNEWESAHEAARCLDILQSGIQHCCKGRFKTYKGFIWRYKEDIF